MVSTGKIKLAQDKIIPFKDIICWIFLERNRLKCNTRETFKNSFHKALDGYDIGLSNPFAESGDPAIKGRIFDVYCNGQNGKDGHYNFVRLEEDRNCDSRFQSKVVTSSKEYAEELGSTNKVIQFLIMNFVINF